MGFYEIEVFLISHGVLRVAHGNLRAGITVFKTGETFFIDYNILPNYF